MNNIIIECIKLSKSYKNGDSYHDIFNNISFKLRKGEISGIVGKSGSGKSTFLHLIAGLDTPTSGSIFFYNRSFNSMKSYEIAKFRNTQLGFIYQFHHLMLDFNVLENVAMPLLIDNQGVKESEEKSYELLKKIKLEHKIKKYPSELSGGERQRVAIARAFINKPDLIIADELTGNLDNYHVNIVLNLIFEFSANFNTSFLIATHDPILIKKIPYLFQIKNGELLNYEN